MVVDLDRVGGLDGTGIGQRQPRPLRMGDGDEGPGSDRASWLARADGAMYLAKRAGRSHFLLDGDDIAQAVG